MKLIYKILISITVVIVFTFGGIIYGRYSVEKTSTKYTRQITGELESSLDANRQIISHYSGIEEENRRVRAATTELVNGVGDDVEQLEDGIVITRKLVEECFEFIQQLREIYNETEER